MNKALHPRDDKDYMYKEKKEENSSALMTTYRHRYKDNTKKNKKRLITTASNRIGKIRPDRKMTKARKQNGKKNNDGYFKPTKLHTRKPRH